MSLAVAIERVPLSRLRPHPENSLIFGEPEDSDGFDTLIKSLKAHGQMEPIVAKRDGVILAGHRRCEALRALGSKDVEVRWIDCDSYREELEYVVRSNTDRRQLMPQEIAFAWKRLNATPKADGGAKAERGRPKKGGAETTFTKSRDDAAEMLGVGVNEARALDTVFNTPGVAHELQQAVNEKRIAPTPAAKAVAAEVKRQGGEIKSPIALAAWTEQKTAPKAPREKPAHESRVEEQAAAFRACVSELFELYKSLNKILSRTPLKGVIGPTEHHEYATLIRDVSIRAWREIESVQGPTATGKQMALVALDGGRT